MIIILFEYNYFLLTGAEGLKWNLAECQELYGDEKYQTALNCLNDLVEVVMQKYLACKPIPIT